MIDLEAKRQENLARLIGKEIPTPSKTPYVIEDLKNADVCWDIISMCVRKKTEEYTSSNGKPMKRATKERVYPQLVKEENVASTASKSKEKVYKRTNLTTMEEMFKFRNKMNKFYIGEPDGSTYYDYFKNVVETLDGYALQVITDIITNDADFLKRVNEIRCK